MDSDPANQPEVLVKTSAYLSKKTLLMFFFTALILAGLGIYLYFTFFKFAAQKPVKIEAEVPVSLENPAVFSFALAYNFHATLKEINDIGNNQKLLITSIDGVDMPQFIVTQETKFFIDEKNTQVEIPVSLLKKDSRISIIASYIPRTKKWEVTKVRVLKN